jgi:hypothetical protein
MFIPRIKIMYVTHVTPTHALLHNLRVQRACSVLLSRHFQGDYSNISLTFSDPMSEIVQHYDFPVPDVFLDL